MTSDKDSMSKFAMGIIGMKSDGEPAIGGGFMLVINNDGEMIYLDPTADGNCFTKATDIAKARESYKWKFFESHADMTAFVEEGKRNYSGQLSVGGGVPVVTDGKIDVSSAAVAHNG